jgi:hypothetical protein
MTIKRVGPLSWAKVAAALYAVIGLVVGIAVSVAAMAGAFAANDEAAGVLGLGLVFGVGAIVVMPVMYACMGFVATLVLTGLYNKVAEIVGGVEVDIS